MLDLTTIKQQLTKNHGGNLKTVQYIVLHSTESDSTPGTIAWIMKKVKSFMNPKSQASAHYIISRTGEIIQLVPLTKVAWAVLRANSITINVEHQGYSERPGWFTPEMFKASTELTAALCKKFNLDPNFIIGHNDWRLKPYGNNHRDPIIFDWVSYRNRVREILNET